MIFVSATQRLSCSKSYEVFLRVNFLGSCNDVFMKVIQRYIKFVFKSNELEHTFGMLNLNLVKEQASYLCLSPLLRLKRVGEHIK